jgi:hypothetical protein
LFYQVRPPLYQNGEVLLGDILDGLPRVKAKAFEALAGQGKDSLVKFKEDNPGVFQGIRPDIAGKGRMIRLKYSHKSSLSGVYIGKLLTFEKKRKNPRFTTWPFGKIGKNLQDF